jgi:hypothetical protein
MRPGGGGARSFSNSGGTYIVFVLRDGRAAPTVIKTGLPTSITSKSWTAS